jgi:cytochrome c-type biogenesis protein CcmH
MIRAVLVVLAMMCAPLTPVLAVQPDEVLADQALEARARDLSRNIRCLVCRNESIDESNADLARDLRILVRERLVAGDTDGEVFDYLVARYGEYVLLATRRNGANLLLWLAGPAMLLIAGATAGVYLRGRGRMAEGGLDALDDAEKARLKSILQARD